MKESALDSRDFASDEQGDSGIVEEDGESSLAFIDLTQLPISYGERLILMTCMLV